jgi:alkylation response protein AidB-like acyl-CoA dehydrogenase
MDFTYTEEEEKFRKEVRTWLKDNVPKGWKSLGFELPSDPKRAGFLKQWDNKLYRAGYAGLSWPKEYGGRGLPATYEVIFVEEMSSTRAPTGLGYFGKVLVGPTIMAYGSEEQKKRYLPKILSGEEIWCQGFSEPSAGSDLASLKTSAKLSSDGKEFRVNGQKVWTSAAQFADFCLLLARTDETLPKHKGLSYLIVDMKEHGIKLSPIIQMTGEAGFNQIFFENVRVPRENLVGELNAGWTEAMTTLAHERGVTTYAGLQQMFISDLEEVIGLAKKIERRGQIASKDIEVRQKITQFYIENSILKLLNFKQLTRLQKGGFLGPESSISKLYWSEMHQRFGDFVMELLGEKSQIIEGKDAVADGKWQRIFLWSRSETIYAGTSEIQRNIIADIILGLPRVKGGG